MPAPPTPLRQPAEELGGARESGRARRGDAGSGAAAAMSLAQRREDAEPRSVSRVRICVALR